MNSSRLIAPIVTFLLLSMMAVPSSASTEMEEEGKQVSEGTWNIIRVFGDATLSNCHSNLYNDDESADYGEQRNSDDVVNIDFTCSMNPVLDRDLILIEGDNIETRFKIELDGQWTNGQDDCTDDCEDLIISLIKGDDTVATREFDNLDLGTNVIHWDIPIYGDLVYWNGSSDNIAIKFTMKIKPVEGGWFSEDRDAVFGLYYSPTENDEVEFGSDLTQIKFPLDTTCTASCGGGLGDFMNPGFTWIMGAGGLALGALIVPSSKDEE